MWDRRALEKLWTQKEMPLHKTFQYRMPYAAQHNPIASSEKIANPPLHLKLLVLWNSINPFNFCTFPALLYDAIRAGMLGGSHIRKCVGDKGFIHKMNSKGKLHEYLS